MSFFFSFFFFETQTNIHITLNKQTKQVQEFKATHLGVAFPSKLSIIVLITKTGGESKITKVSSWWAAALARWSANLLTSRRAGWIRNPNFPKLWEQVLACIDKIRTHCLELRERQCNSTLPENQILKCHFENPSPSIVVTHLLQPTVLQVKLKH